MVAVSSKLTSRSLDIFEGVMEQRDDKRVPEPDVVLSLCAKWKKANRRKKVGTS